MGGAVAEALPAFSFAGGKLQISMRQAMQLVTAFPRNTLNRFDFSGGGGWNAVDGSDIGRLIAMVGFPQATAAALVSEWPNAPWHHVPIDCRLEDALRDSVLEAGGISLHDYFDELPGVGWGITSKLLHLKRPGFFPILDSVVERLYRPVASTLAGGLLYPPVQCYWQAIRDDLIAPGQRVAIDSLRANLVADPDPGVRMRAVLSVLRLRDILIWMARPDAALTDVAPAGTIPSPEPSVGAIGS